MRLADVTRVTGYVSNFLSFSLVRFSTSAWCGTVLDLPQSRLFSSCRCGFTLYDRSYSISDLHGHGDDGQRWSRERPERFRTVLCLKAVLYIGFPALEDLWFELIRMIVSNVLLLFLNYKYWSSRFHLVYGLVRTEGLEHIPRPASVIAPVSSYLFYVRCSIIVPFYGSGRTFEHSPRC